MNRVSREPILSSGTVGATPVAVDDQLAVRLPRRIGASIHMRGSTRPTGIRSYARSCRTQMTENTRRIPVTDLEARTGR